MSTHENSHTTLTEKKKNASICHLALLFVFSHLPLFALAKTQPLSAKPGGDCLTFKPTQECEREIVHE